MEIGIVLYSETGHTRSVAARLKARLAADGHQVAMIEIETAGPLRRSAKSAELAVAPPLDGYEAVVLCAPVWGGLPAPPMASYLEQLGSLQGKRVACLVTGFFPAAAWGREQTLARMQEVCEAKGAVVCGRASVGWFSLTRGRQVARAVESLAGCLGR